MHLRFIIFRTFYRLASAALLLLTTCKMGEKEREVRERERGKGLDEVYKNVSKR